MTLFLEEPRLLNNKENKSETKHQNMGVICYNLVIFSYIVLFVVIVQTIVCAVI